MWAKDYNKKTKHMIDIALWLRDENRVNDAMKMLHTGCQIFEENCRQSFKGLELKWQILGPMVKTDFLKDTWFMGDEDDERFKARSVIDTKSINESNNDKKKDEYHKLTEKISDSLFKFGQTVRLRKEVIVKSRIA